MDRIRIGKLDKMKVHTSTLIKLKEFGFVKENESAVHAETRGIDRQRDDQPVYLSGGRELPSHIQLE